VSIVWALSNTTPYAVDKNWTRDRDGKHLWIVAVKATFDIVPDGQLKLADEQVPPVLVPEFHGDPAASSLKVDSDLLAVKPGCDVVIDGVAHAPRERPASVVPVSIRVGPLRKAIAVSGPRVFYKGATGLAMTSPQPFATHPIRYEDAFGGSDLADPNPNKQRIDFRNPVGKGFAMQSARLIHQPAPRTEYFDANLEEAGPAGFGPIASHWLPRLRFAGTYDERWQQLKKPLLPDDYDDRHAMCAPRDQQIVQPFHGGEPVELVNLSAEGVLRFDLPRMHFGFSTRFGQQREEHSSRLVTVFLVPHERRVMMVWQTVLIVAPANVDYLDETTIREKRYLR
jgi:hypothetical protein